MTCSRRPERTANEDGFTTAAFAALTFGLALIAAASVLVARGKLEAAEHDVRQTQEAYVLAGVATAAAVRLLSDGGAPSLRWSEDSAVGQVVVTVEPEGRKVTPLELGRPDNAKLISALVGQVDADQIEAGVAALKPAADGRLHRSQLVRLGASRRWRECALTLTSPYSRLTAFDLADLGAPEDTGTDPHAGELWRVAVDAPDGTWLDRVVRMTGAAGAPVAIVEQEVGRSPGNGRARCLPDLLRLSGRSI